MTMRRWDLPVTVAVALTASVAAAQTPLGSAFTYQGQLLEDGAPVTDPALNMRFRLYDADVGGNQVGSDDVPFGGVNVVDGLFSVELDFGLMPFSGDERWLEIAVYKIGIGYVTLTPRQRIAAAPYALYTLSSGSGSGTCLWSQNGSDIYYNLGEVGIGTPSPSYPLHVESAAAIPLYAHTTSSTGAAVDAEATSSSGTVNGVFAQTASAEGSGVFGQNTSGTGDNEGIFGVSWSPSGKGVFGYNGSTSGTAIGVLGRTSNGYGVRGEATGTSASNYGVYGVASGSGTGVRGQSTDGYGVYGSSTTDWCVVGVSPQNSGQAGVVGAIINHTGGMLWKSNSGVSGSCEDGQGVAGRTFSGVGVFGEQVNSGNVGELGTADAGVYGQTANAEDFGVWGHSSNSNGYAGYFTGGKNYFEGPVAVGVLPGTDPKLDVLTSTFTAVRGTTSNTSGRGVWGYASAGSGQAYGVYGLSASPSGAGVCGESGSAGNPAVMGVSTSGVGEGGWFESQYGDALYAEASAPAKAALRASIQDQAYGIVVNQSNGYNLEPAIQVNGTGHTTGIDVNLQNGFSRLAEFTLDNGDLTQTAFLVEADTAGPVAEFIGTNTANSDHVLTARNGGTGSSVYGEQTRASNDAPAVYGKHAVTDYYGVGVKGEGGYHGVEGRSIGSGSSTYTGVYAYTSGGTGTCRGVYAQAQGGGTNYGVYGAASGGTTNYAGYFSGNVSVTGTLSKGGGSFKIDHPLDPENKYLYHSFVESPDMMNIYNGNVTLDANGEATVTLPDWFEALNMEFRYQLTCIGGFAQVYIAEEIADNQFKIAGGTPGLKVSWQVTGVRHDAFAEANRIPVEVDKPADERGTYLHPEAFGLSADRQVDCVHEAAEERAHQGTSGTDQ
jgi:hypothetical protein